MPGFPVGYPVKLSLIGLLAVALSGCGANRSNLSLEGQPSPTSTSPIAPTIQGEGGLSGGGQPTSCETANYFTEVVWQAGQPRMTLVQRATAANGYQDTVNLNKAPATRKVNDDRSTTFASRIEGGTIYTRVFPNDTCFIQSVASNGSVVFEENGRVRGNNTQTTGPVNPAIVPPGPTQDKPSPASKLPTPLLR